MEYKLRKSKEQVIEIARSMVKFARSLGCDDVEFSPEEEQEEEEEELEPPNSSKKEKKKRKSTEPRKRAAKRAWLSLAKPSYGLGLGSRKLRFESRARLTRLLRSLVSQRCWTEACGVLSVLLKSTPRDTSLLNNRFKYSALMEVLANLGDEYFNEGKIKNIYHLWIRKIGSLKNPQDENRFVVRLEFIVFCLTQGNVDDAHQAALWLMQERNFGRDPAENMVVGLTFYQLWFSTIPKDLLWTRDIESSTPEQSRDLIAYSGADTNEVSTGCQCDSVSSVRNDKILAADGDEGNPIRVDIIKVENLPQNNQALAISAESTGNETSTSNRADVSPYTSTLSALEGLSPSLFPIQLPQSIGDGEDLYHLHMKLLNDYYKEALKYLSIALHSTPPALEALLPFIQLLLVGGKVGEALSELDKLSCNSSATLPIRLRASILEHFDRSNIAVLSTCFEDILKKDPTCCHALEKLITMHQNGEYSYESLLEMIAWHLDSTYASHETWKELASCFLKLSENEEDRMSVCQDGNQGERESVSFSTIPKVFTQGVEGKNWRLRCRWWLNRHFNCNTLASEIASGDLELPGYKAACASHIYGPELAYVVDVYSCLEKQNETDLFLFLKQNIKKSIRLYSSFKQN